jgi:hypothetical protein
VSFDVTLIKHDVNPIGKKKKEQKKQTNDNGCFGSNAPIVRFYDENFRGTWVVMGDCV